MGEEPDLLIGYNGRIIKSFKKTKNKKIPKRNFFEELLIDNFICTATVCARTDLVKNSIKEIGEKYNTWIQGDRPLWMEISRHSKIGYINESLAVHRVLEESAQHTKDKKKKYNFLKSSYDIRFFFIDKHGCSEETRLKVLKQYHKMVLRNSFLLHNKKEATESYEFLKNYETDDKDNRENYYYYLGAKNIINWIFIRLFLKLKKELFRERKRD